MKFSSKVEALNSKKLCSECIGDVFLSNLVIQNGKRRKCDYCQASGKTFDLSEIADLVETAFDTHYYRTPTDPDFMEQALLADKESDYEWEREGLPVIDAIGQAADIEFTVAKDIQVILDERHSYNRSYEENYETKFSEDSHYAEKNIPDHVWQQQWNQFERMIKTETRFFSRAGAKFLGEIFNDIDKKATYNGRPVVVTAGKGKPLEFLYRARVFQSLDSLEAGLKQPDLHLGPPPSILSKAGRMNAAGISIFYGATNPKIALAEVRPPVGSYVAVAKFEIIRDLKLLDLTASEAIYEAGSYFDPNYASLLSKARFLRSLQSHITRPVMPDDETLEYVSTQAVADFVATEVNLPLDGIIYRSVQSDEKGSNVVLFRKASGVEKHIFPANSEIQVTMGYFDGEDWVDDINVKITTASDPAEKIEDKPIRFEAFLEQASDLIDLPSELVPAALRLLLESIEIHNITKIQVKSERNKVYWQQSSPDDDMF